MLVTQQTVLLGIKIDLFYNVFIFVFFNKHLNILSFLIESKIVFVYFNTIDFFHQNAGLSTHFLKTNWRI